MHRAGLPPHLQYTDPPPPPRKGSGKWQEASMAEKKRASKKSFLVHGATGKVLG